MRQLASHFKDNGICPKWKGQQSRAISLGDLKFQEMFKSSNFQDLWLSEWLTHTPTELVLAHLNIDKSTLKRYRKRQLLYCLARVGL